MTDAAAGMRLVIVNESPIARAAIARGLISRDACAEATAVADAGQAIGLLGREPVDAVLLTISAGAWDAPSALPRLIAVARAARVPVIAMATADRADAAVQALTGGVAEVMLAPVAPDPPAMVLDGLAARLTRIGRGVPAAGTGLMRPAPPLPTGGDDIECIAIGGADGGAHALAPLLRALPERLEAAVLVTQDVPPPLLPAFARHMEEIAGRAVEVARDGRLVVPGAVLLAPGDAHLRVARSAGGVRVRLDHAPSASGRMPSIDAMLMSVAEVYGAGGLGVVLSGSGRDGLIGAGLLAAHAAEILVQDAATATAWGLPGVIARAGIASAILPPPEIAKRIGARLARNAGCALWARIRATETG